MRYMLYQIEALDEQDAGQWRVDPHGLMGPPVEALNVKPLRAVESTSALEALQEWAKDELGERGLETYQVWDLNRMEPMSRVTFRFGQDEPVRIVAMPAADVAESNRG